jgi:hypothetical protein
MNRARPDGLQFYCKSCFSARAARGYRERRARLGKSVRERVEVPSGHKRCPGCQEIKPHADWHRNRTSSDGFADRCKRCRSVRQREDHLRRTFGITVAEREALFEAQGGLCAICRENPPTDTDHDHETGAVRGLLCNGCNVGIGHFRDDPNRLLAAVAYLAKHGRKAANPPQPVVVELYPARGDIVYELDGYRHRHSA